MTNEGTTVIQGVVRRVAVEKESLSVKIRKGGKIMLLFSPQTEFIGASSLEELKRRQQVKVWHTSENGDHWALKLELLPELGC